jgi:hypothetical protein
MNGYAFEYDKRGQVVRSRIYHRVAWDGTKPNDLLPYLSQMRDFSNKSRFRDFYAAHQSFYQGQVRYFRDEIDIAGMMDWLRSRFPGSRPMDTVNIIFSPLVGWNQSLTLLESNGFRELQPHVNFPYPRPSDAGYSPAAVALRRGYILFTELNHGFINPAAEPYEHEIAAALADRAFWVSKGSAGDNYPNPSDLFNEMMNWGLVSLYLVDKAPAAERSRMIAALDPYMVRRGFLQFPAFNAFLVELYGSRAPGTSVADLYPKIIAWFAERKRGAASPREPARGG